MTSTTHSRRRESSTTEAAQKPTSARLAPAAKIRDRASRSGARSTWSGLRMSGAAGARSRARNQTDPARRILQIEVVCPADARAIIVSVQAVTEQRGVEKHRPGSRPEIQSPAPWMKAFVKELAQQCVTVEEINSRCQHNANQHNENIASSSKNRGRADGCCQEGQHRRSTKVHGCDAEAQGYRDAGKGGNRGTRLKIDQRQRERRDNRQEGDVVWHDQNGAANHRDPAAST